MTRCDREYLLVEKFYGDESEDSYGMIEIRWHPTEPWSGPTVAAVWIEPSGECYITLPVRGNLMIRTVNLMQFRRSICDACAEAVEQYDSLRSLYPSDPRPELTNRNLGARRAITAEAQQLPSGWELKITEPGGSAPSVKGEFQGETVFEISTFSVLGLRIELFTKNGEQKNGQQWMFPCQEVADALDAAIALAKEKLT